jgi:hypothetical protein
MTRRATISFPIGTVLKKSLILVVDEIMKTIINYSENFTSYNQMTVGEDLLSNRRGYVVCLQP